MAADVALPERAQPLLTMYHAIDIIQRWRAMDCALSFNGLNVEAFAKEMRASLKTVRRDLYALRDLGQETHARRIDDGTYLHFYVKGVEPLFSCNRPRYKNRGLPGQLPHNVGPGRVRRKPSQV